MPAPSKAAFAELQSLAFGSISGAYASIGSPLPAPARIIKITNYTNEPVLISIDGVTNHDFIAEKGFALYDVMSNKSQTSSEELAFPAQTQVSVKQLVGAPTSGSVYLTILYNT